MFGSSRSSSPFSLMDLDMWDTKSRFTAQTSAWYGMAAVSGSGFLSQVSTRTSGSTGAFRQNDPSLRTWQSSSHLAPGGPTRSFPSSPRAELKTTQGESPDVVQWLQEAEKHVDAHLDHWRSGDAGLSCNTPTAQLLDMKHMKEKQRVDRELLKLTQALKEAEAKAKTQEMERNKALQQLHTLTERQRTLLSQMEEMNQRLSHTVSTHCEVQEQLTEANNKISQSCLEKAILSTQVLKLEDQMRELKAKLALAVSSKDHLLQMSDMRTRSCSESCRHRDQPLSTESDNNKQDEKDVLMREESKSLREVNEKLTGELDAMKEKLDVSQSQLQELTAERVTSTQQIQDLEAECSEMIRQREELLSKMNEGGQEVKELRESVGVLELEKQTLQSQCLCLEADVLRNEEKIHLLEEEYRKQDAARVQNIEELKAVASHWTEKWQKVALVLQVTQEELKELQKNTSRKERDSDSLLKVELDACKQELELERSRSLLHRYKDKGGEAVQTHDKATATDLSESSELWAPGSDSHSSQNKFPQISTDRWSWQQRPGLMPVFEEDEESGEVQEGEEEEPAGEAHAGENLHSQGSQMSGTSAGISNLKETNETLLQVIRMEQPNPGLRTAAEDVSVEAEGANAALCVDECDLQTRTPLLCPDGVFLAQLVDICSPDEDADEPEGEAK